jgi:NAD(P)H-hydrate epimerase
MISSISSQVIVTAAQMQAIENLIFQSGMPVAALMEKVALRIVQRIDQLYPVHRFPKVGILVGSGHNGGDALVVARELYHQGRQVKVCSVLPKAKPLTRVHTCHAKAIGIPFVVLTDLQDCDLLVDGIFVFGLERDVDGDLAISFNLINSWQIPILAIDLPSGLNCDRGHVMGVAIRATHTLCLGLWKRGLLIEQALPYIGILERVDFDIPDQFIMKVLGDRHPLWRIDPHICLRQYLPIPRPIAVHKYNLGHLLLVVGSQRYAGAAILAALGAKATGVGMLSIAVPSSLKLLVLAQVPDALVIGCPETDSGAIDSLAGLDLQKYQAIVCGCGLSLDSISVVKQTIDSDIPLVLDADGLNAISPLADPDLIRQLHGRSNPIIFTPHGGEFSRLFPDLMAGDRLDALRLAVEFCHATILLKGARTMISFLQDEKPRLWVNPESTPALARGGSGDVLAGMIGGLLAQGLSASDSAIVAAVWHSQSAISLANQRSIMGVDPVSLAHHLLPFLLPVVS